MNESKQPALPVGQVLVGDAVERLRDLPTGSVDTAVTSPPYFLLRDYGMDGQIGLEVSVDEWVQRLLAVLGEVGRVLRPNGSLWLNVGDTFARSDRHGAQPKGLILAPERLLLALTDEGWIVRNKVVWAKKNAMPASARDRLSTTWEPIYLLTRDRSYYFDLDAIRVPALTQRNGAKAVRSTAKYGNGSRVRPHWSGPLAGNNAGLARMKARGDSSHPLGKNPGDVWSISTASFRGAHFATFPEALVERPLLATCPERICATCGQPWRRVPMPEQLGSLALRGGLRKSCGCEDRAWQPGIVLDPFMGAGTVGVVATRLHRRWLGIELNPKFAALATERIAAVADGVAAEPTDS